jgi:hypothetical protein
VIKKRKKIYKNDYPIKWDFMNMRTNVIEHSIDTDLMRMAKLSNIIHWFIFQYELKRISDNTINYYNKLYQDKYNAEALNVAKEYLLKMKNLANDLNSEFILVIFPIIYWPDHNYPFEKIHEKLHDMSKELDIQVVDLKESFLKYKDEELWVHPVDQHPNDLAHKITADKILNFIRAN